MIYRIQFSANAEKDAGKAGKYYEKAVAGLSLRFYNDLDNTLSSLTKNPSAFHFHKNDKNIRRANLDVFPFAVYFHINTNESTVFVLAIIHQRRSKAYIRRRLR